MPAAEQFPCLGLSILGMCSYNPAQPTSIYFSLGDVIAALGLTIAIQQFLKPIYLFRLQAYGIKLGYLFSLIALGFISVVIAAVLPHFPITHRSPLGYPITWELLGAILIASAYGATVFISLRPARIYHRTLLSFVRAAGNLLSKADDEDRVSFAEDLLHSLPNLIKYAEAWEHAEWNSREIESERLRERGAPLQISGRPPINPFYEFAHRKELERASYASTLLEIIADPYFCAALVHKCPWLIAAILRDVSEKELYVRQADRFVQEIARQAILHEESMMAREIDYSGFGSVPLLSESLFSNWFILSNYNPLQTLSLETLPESSEGYITRLNRASQMMLKTAIQEKDYWHQRYIYSVEDVYKNLFLQLGFKRYKDLSSGFLVQLHMGLTRIYNLTIEGIESLEQNWCESLFIREANEYRHDLIHSIASIVYESLASIANSFTGYDDDGWIHTMRTFMDIYPFHADTPVGMNPLQQQLAVQLMDKLQQNMEGWYPAISRVLLAVIGPYDDHPQVTTRTAYVIIKDAVYKALQRLPELHARQPEKVTDFLPSNVSYDAKTNSLTHTYRGGGAKVTNLSMLVIPEVNLFDESNWRS